MPPRISTAPICPSTARGVRRRSPKPRTFQPPAPIEVDQSSTPPARLQSPSTRADQHVVTQHVEEQTMTDGGSPQQLEIVTREDYSDVTYSLEVHHPMMARAARPGQFVIVMLSEHGERIPLTIADYDREGGTVTLVIQAVGKTTREMQAACR